MHEDLVDCMPEHLVAILLALGLYWYWLLQDMYGVSVAYFHLGQVASLQQALSVAPHAVWRHQLAVGQGKWLLDGGSGCWTGEVAVDRGKWLLTRESCCWRGEVGVGKSKWLLHRASGGLDRETGCWTRLQHQLILQYTLLAVIAFAISPSLDALNWCNSAMLCATAACCLIAMYGPFLKLMLVALRLL